MKLTLHIEKLIQKIREAVKPPPDISIPDWVYENRRLPSSYAAEAGAMDIAGRTPYLVEICKAAVDPNIRRITWRTSTQVGKSELLNNIIFYMAKIQPGPMLMVQPTKEFMKSYSKEKIKPSILESPRIREIFYTPTTKGTLLTYPFRGGFLKCAGSNVATDLASSAIRTLLFDEADRFAESAGNEGDPTKIARKRTDTYSHNYLEIMTSTPTFPDAPITRNFLQGTQEHYHVPCPFCNKKQKLEFGNLKWDKDKKDRHLPKTAKYECQHCDELIPYNKQPWMLARGIWVAENDTLDKSHRSFQLNQLYSPFAPWSRMVEEYLESKKDGMDGEKTFVNTSLGLPFKKKVDTPSWEDVYNKRGEYKIGDKLNNGICVLVCGVDYQKNYLKAQVYGIGKELECWHVDNEVIPGNFEDDPKVKERLARFIDRTYETEDGREIGLERTWIDVGWNTEIMYNWITLTMEYSQSKVVAGVGRSKTQVTQLMGYPNPKNKRQIFVANVDDFKSNIYFRLGKLRKEGPNPNYIHIGNMEIDWFKELCSEAEITTMDPKTKRLKTYWEVTADNGRNEVLDGTVYAIGCCVEITEIKKWTPEEWDTRMAYDQKATLLKKNEVKAEPVPKKQQQSSHWGEDPGSHWG